MKTAEFKRLGDYVKIKTGKLDANASSEDGEYPFFTCSIEPLKISTYSYDCECCLVAGNGDLNVKYYNGKFDAYQRTYIIESLDKEKLDVMYMYFFLSSYIEILRKQSIGGVIKYIKLGNLTDALIPIPELKKQKEICQNLIKAQKILTSNEKLLSKYDILIKSRFIEMFGDPVINEKDWDLKTLPKLGEFGRGVSKHRPRNAPELLGGKYPLIQTGDVANANLYITNYESTYSEEGFKQSKMWKAGTLCITIAATIAKTAILTFDSCFPDSVVGFTPNEKTNSLFINYWFSFFQKILEEQAPAVAQKNINLQVLSELKIITPPISLQNNFAAFVHQIDKSKFEIWLTLKNCGIIGNRVF
jgi:type I restriction enzyme S subunit